MSEQGLTKVLLCVSALLLSGCVGIFGPEAIAGQQACASHGGVKTHWPVVWGGYHVTCQDGTEINGEVK